MTKTLQINGQFFSVNEGQFDSRNRHVRQPALTANIDYWMVQGPTLAVRVLKDPNGWTVFWRWECGPRSVTQFSPFNNAQYAPPLGFAVDRGGAL